MTGLLSSLLLLAAAGLVLAFGPPLPGYAPAEAAALLLYGAGLLSLTGWAVARGRPGVRDAAGALAMWAVFATSLTSLYVKRDEAVAALRDVAGDAGYGPAAATVTGSGEIAVLRRRDGTFRIPTRLNDKPFDFIFDTGATSVVIRAETARELGFPPEGLRYRVPVMTANGATMAAPVTIDRLAIGPIALSRVQALVTRPGLLVENLLGQNVLDRLESYEVRANRLVLRAGKG